MTLKHRPSEEELRDLPVGARCKIVVSGPTVQGHGVDAVAVVSLRCTAPGGAGEFDGADLLRGKRRPHVTLSTVAPSLPKDANDLDRRHVIQAGKVERLTLVGVVGLQVAEQPVDPLGPLPTKVIHKLRQFTETAEPSAKLKFHAQELSAADRAVIHDFAEANNTASASSGPPSKRRLTLTMKRPVAVATRTDASDGNGADERALAHANEARKHRCVHHGGGTRVGTVRRITDPSVFAALNVVGVASRTPQFAGSISSDGSGICWAGGTDPTAGAQVVVLRGLPGSGKSGVAQQLAGDTGHICSADDFFETGAGVRKRKGDRPAYAECFSLDLLADAHGHCWRQFEDALHHLDRGEGDRIIVDNTNCRTRDYTRYAASAAIAALSCVVVELHTTDKAAALRFNARSVHSVPSHVNLHMLSRWEKYDAAILLAPAGPSSDDTHAAAGAEHNTATAGRRRGVAAPLDDLQAHVQFQQGPPEDPSGHGCRGQAADFCRRAQAAARRVPPVCQHRCWTIFTCACQPRAIPHALCDMVCLVPVLIGC